jgi:hypothetical protein
MAVEAETERGLAMRVLLHSPKDMVAGALAFAAVSAIVANALFLQAGQHPSPMFGSVVAMPVAGAAPVSPLPRPRPMEIVPKSAESPLSELKAVEPKLAESKLAEPKTAEPKSADLRNADSKNTDPMANLVRATAAAPVAPSSSVPRPPAPIPASSRNETGATSAQGSRRVAAVQRALTDYGFGQLKPTGTVGSDTQAAIQKFERARKIPVTGQMSDRLVRELVAMIGHPID